MEVKGVKSTRSLIFLLCYGHNCHYLLKLIQFYKIFDYAITMLLLILLFLVWKPRGNLFQMNHTVV